MNSTRNVDVLFFVYRLDDYSGAAKQAFKLAKYLRGNARIRIINVQAAKRPKAVRREVVDGVEVYHISGSLIVRIFQVTSILLRRDYDLLHLHGFFAYPLFLATLLRVKTILKSTLLGDDDFESLRRKRCGWLRLALARSASLNNALTKRMYEINRRYLPEHRVTVIPNGVEINVHVSAEKNFSAPMFIFVGALVRRKRPDLAIRYFSEHYTHIPGATLWLIGPTSIGLAEETSGYKDECERLAAPHAEKIHFVGNIPIEQVYEYYQRAVALLFFSEGEGIPNVVLEAMSNNCVPVTYEMNGVAHDIIEGGVSGFVISSGIDCVSLAEIRRVAESGAPRNRIIERFSIEKNARGNLDAYMRVLRGE